MRRLIWDFAGPTYYIVEISCHGSNDILNLLFSNRFTQSAAITDSLFYQNTPVLAELQISHFSALEWILMENQIVKMILI